MTIPGEYTTADTANCSRNTPELATSAKKLPALGRRCSEGHSTAKLDAGTAVCQTVSLSAMLAGFSQYVVRRVRAPANCSVSVLYSLTWLDCTVTAMLSGFRYSSATTLVLKVCVHSLSKRPSSNPLSETNRTRSGPHENAAHRRYAATRYTRRGLKLLIASMPIRARLAVSFRLQYSK
jgi:hypothetical protein